MGNASLAIQHVPLPEDSVLTLMGEVMRSAERAAHLTAQMLAYSGRGKFVVQQVNLSEFTRDIVSLLQGFIPRTAQLQVQLAAEVPFIEADIAQLQQVIMNLVINGAEAIGDVPGVVTVRTGVREFAQEQIRASLGESGIVPGRYVFLEVKDTGCGVPAQKFLLRPSEITAAPSALVYTRSMMRNTRLQPYGRSQRSVNIAGEFVGCRL